MDAWKQWWDRAADSLEAAILLQKYGHGHFVVPKTHSVEFGRPGGLDPSSNADAAKDNTSIVLEPK